MKSFGLLLVAGGILLIYWVNLGVKGVPLPKPPPAGTPGLKLQPGTAGQ